MRPKKLLKLNYCHWLGEDQKYTAGELEKRYPGWKRLPSQVSQFPYAAVAVVALHPAILAEREMFTAEKRDFAGCYARFPDLVIEALAYVRELARQREREALARRQKDSTTQAGRVREFLLTTPSLAKKNGKFVPVEKLAVKDYQQDPRKLRPGIRIVEVAKLTDGEVAQYLSCAGFQVSEPSVKRARQSLCSQR